MQFSVSMLHQQQTLLSSPSPSPSPSAFFSKFHFPPLSSSAPVRVPYSRSSQAEKERRMESVEFSFARQQHGGFVVDDGHDDVAWAVEKGSFFGSEDFLVDDLLDLGELETELEDEEEDQRQSQKEEKEVEKQEEEEEEEVKQEEEEEAVGILREDNKSDFSLPANDDVADLEWVSRMVDDSYSEVPTYETHHQLQPQAMASAPPLPPLPSAVPVRARRSKRARTLSGSSWSSSSYSSWDEGGPLVFLDSSTSSSTTTTTTTTTTNNSSATSSCSSSSYPSSQLLFARHLFDEIHLLPSLPPPTKNQHQKPKRRGRKPKAPWATATAAANGGGGERRCSHCGVNKTPQWRTGPMGAKTLCNACGVRYKSGRLLPEYRPACSPTFISHVHSNSHRKVIEMRRKREEEEQQKLEKKQRHQ